MFDRLFTNRRASEHPDADPDVFLSPDANPDGAEVEAATEEVTAEDAVPQGISFANDDPGAIFAAAESGDGGEIARALLKQPVDGVSLQLSTEAGHFGLYATVEYGGDKDAVRKVFNRASAILNKQAKAAGQTTDERGGNLIVAGAAGTRVVIGPERGYLYDRRLHVTTGRVKEGYDSHIDVLPPLELDKSTFTNALSDVLGVLALTLNVSYDNAREVPPTETIAVRAPRSSTRSSGGAPATRGPENISDQFGAERPEVRFEDIGGQPDAITELESLAFAVSHPELYKKWGTRPPKGVLLYGPPGTGKTLLAKALASQADAAFFSISPTDIASKWHGESESMMQGVFSAARREERAIVYFDEMEAIAPARNDNQHEVTRRVISTLLQNIDGMPATENVIVVGATNRKDDVDPAMLRPGRLDRWIEVNLPDSVGRKQIFDIHMRRAIEFAERQLFDQAIDMQLLVEVANGHSGADIAEIIRRTLEKKVRIEGMTGVEPAAVSTRDILDELSDYERALKQHER